MEKRKRFKALVALGIGAAACAVSFGLSKRYVCYAAEIGFRHYHDIGAIKFYNTNTGNEVSMDEFKTLLNEGQMK